MKSLTRAMLFVLLGAICAVASAQRNVLYSPLPTGTNRQQAMEAAWRVLVARGWLPAQTDRDSLEARKGMSGIRIAMRDNSLRYQDMTERARMRQRNREEGPSLTAIPQPELDGLRADLAAAFAARFPPVPGIPVATPSEVLLGGIDSRADPASVLEVARRAFVDRRWNVSAEGEETFVARIHAVDTDSTLRVFVADGALRYTDHTVDRRGAKGNTPDRWIANVRADIDRALAALPTREAAPPAGPGDAGERLRKLKAMLDSGLISQGEYDTKRAEILKGL